MAVETKLPRFDLLLIPRGLPSKRGKVTVFVVVFLISNINATKGVELGPLITDGAFFLFPLAYIVGDVLAECYGFKSTRRAIYIGFCMAILAVVCFYIAICCLRQASMKAKKPSLRP